MSTWWKAAALALTVAVSGALTGCAVVGVAAAVVGTTVSVAGAVVSTGVEVTGKVVGAGIDAVTPSKKPDAPAQD